MKERGNAKFKFLDKFIGIPLIFLLGLLRLKKQIRTNPPQTIIIVMIAAIGDTVLLSSILKEIKHYYPNVKITLVCSNGNIQAVKSMPHIHHIIKFDFSKIWKSFFIIRKQEKYDLLLDFGAWSRLNAFISFVIKAKYKVGFKRKHMFRHYIYDKTADHSDHIHELDNYRNILRDLDYSLLMLKPEFLISRESIDKIRTILNLNQNYIIFHMFASGSHKKKKEWPESSWLELADHVIEENYKIILTGGKQDAIFSDSFANKVNGMKDKACISLAGKLNLEETAALIKEVGTIVTVNTGIMHLGAAVGSFIIALHGPTSPLRWGPISETSIILTPRIKCDQLLSLGFEKHHCVIENGCISTIEVKDVYKAIRAR
ncbi:glycosyltransferase family 9 protein [Bacillus sp. S/N-304-OC-R1]|uniref:glycosyltransferase family 9 protein n=1 Tax=Bacillus sp. S/N-304-OC-R1 TaxID=2758034 RepID=UPI001C8ECF20|nr:glycosyltransferase family 9 protein [Bacillus sp. S/N-304-OC-R1]MBY0124254.1 glycosyltransferase family 9 protein [Bacillus sp. S/N-304-OC-R1]